ncbi:MAG TPA: hypothetical protein VGZ00_05090 [Candidatus Baltobacteraceae bacterium]|jgi:hypothetical protein|nr:hypothetical protein [Candidatus Baltobacteraceae bacterium]
MLISIPALPPLSNPPAFYAKAPARSLHGDFKLAYADESRGSQNLGSSAGAPPFPDADVDIISQLMAAMVVKDGPGKFELNIIAIDKNGKNAQAIAVEQQGLGMPFIVPSPSSWPFQSGDRLLEYVNTTTSFVDQQLRTGGAKDRLYGKLLRYAMRGLSREGPHDVASVELVAFFSPAKAHNSEGPAPVYLLVPSGPSNEAKRLAYVEGDKLGFRDPVPIRTWNDMSSEVNDQVAILRTHQQNTERSVQAVVGAPGAVQGILCSLSRHCFIILAPLLRMFSSVATTL